MIISTFAVGRLCCLQYAGPIIQVSVSPQSVDRFSYERVCLKQKVSRCGKQEDRLLAVVRC